MEFEWDPEKARSNLAKHGVAFEDAVFVWDDPLFEPRFDSVVDGEERWKAIGLVGATMVLVVVHAERGEGRIRIISARKATRHERLQYEGQVP